MSHEQQTMLNNRYTYTSDRRIGRGNFGTVFRVFDHIEKTDKALKAVRKLTQDMIDTSANNEIGVLNTLSGIEGVPELYEHFESNSFRYLVLPLYIADLLTLRRRNESRKFEKETVLQVAWHLVKILQDVHQKGIIHQDIKCANIMVTAKPNPFCLIDFGVAYRFLDGRGNRKVIPPQRIQTSLINCKYISPKLANGFVGQETVDLDMLLFALLDCCGKRASTEKDPNVNLEERIKVLMDPEKYFIEDVGILCPIAKSFAKQEYGKTPNYNEIFTAIESVIFGFTPSFTPMDQLKLEKNDKDEHILR